MNIFEIAIRKFVSCLRIFGVCVVDSEVPFCIFAKAVQTNELVLFLGCRLVSAPCTSAVRYNVSLLDEFFCVTERALVKLDCVNFWSGRQSLRRGCPLFTI